MPTRFSRRASDGTVEYHDTKESLIASSQREVSESRAGLFGFIGLVAGGVLTYVALLKFGGMDWPKWLRFSLVLTGAGVTGLVTAKLADIIWSAITVVFVLLIAYLIFMAIWKVV